MKLVLVIPAYDEEAVIGGTLSALPPGLFARVIVAVNGSRDGTARVAREHGAEVVETGERGYGAACLQAMRVLDDPEAIVVWLQADGSEDAGEAPALARPIEEGRADLVIGSRVARAQAGALLPHQRFGNAVASFLIQILFRHRYTDLGPFRAIRVRDLRRLGMRDRNFGWTVEMQVRALQEGLRVMEVPVSYGLRRAGTPKVAGNWRASLRAGHIIISTILRLSLRRPKATVQ